MYWRYGFLHIPCPLRIAHPHYGDWHVRSHVNRPKYIHLPSRRSRDGGRGQTNKRRKTRRAGRQAGQPLFRTTTTTFRWRTRSARPPTDRATLPLSPSVCPSVRRLTNLEWKRNQGRPRLRLRVRTVASRRRTMDGRARVNRICRAGSFAMKSAGNGAFLNLKSWNTVW